MTIARLYQQLPLPPILQKHLLRVAKVGFWLCDHWQGPSFNRELLIRAILVHDLGNLVKFDLSPTAKIKLLSATEIAHWQQIQTELITIYGRDVDQVTLSLLKAMHLTNGDDVATVISKHSGEGLTVTLQEDDWVQKLFDYADFRVGPFGIVTLTERFADLEQRYRHRDPSWSNPVLIASRLHSFLDLEQQIAPQIDVSLTALTDQELTQWSDDSILDRNW